MGKKCAAEIFYTYFFKSNFAIYVSLSLHTGRPSYRRSLQPSKEIFFLNPDPKHSLASGGGEGDGCNQRVLMIFRGPGFLAVSYLAPPPPLPPFSRQQVVAVFLCVVAGRAYRREKWEGSEGGAKPDNNE
jgi:hypothetical protein